MKVAKVLQRSYANAPGKNAVIWFRGCGCACPGCINASFQASGPDFPDNYTREELLDLVVDAQVLHDIQGVVFSGGEPLRQSAADLLWLAEEIKLLDLGLTIFTGWLRKNVAEDRWLSRLFGIADLMICGPYEQNLPSTGPMKASANQEVILLSNRWQHSDLADIPVGEIIIGADGTVATGTGL